MLRSLSSVPTPNLRNFKYLEGFGISKSKVYSRNSPLNFFEAKLIVQEFGWPYSLPTNLDMRIALKAGKINIDRGSEITDTIIAYPDQNNVFSKRIRNPSERGWKPKVLEGTTVVEEGGDYFIEGGKRSVLEDVINPQGKVRKDIESLGIYKGDTLFMEKDLCGDDGLRVVTCFNEGALALLHPLKEFANGFYVRVEGGKQRMIENYL